MLNLHMRRIKGTSYKVVLTGWEPIGIFDKEVFFDLKGMTKAHKDAIAQWHAGTLKERTDHPHAR